MEAKKIKATNDNESPGMDGIPPRLIMEAVEQICIPLARVLNFLKARSCLKICFLLEEITKWKDEGSLYT